MIIKKAVKDYPASATEIKSYCIDLINKMIDDKKMALLQNHYVGNTKEQTELQHINS